MPSAGGCGGHILMHRGDVCGNHFDMLWCVDGGDGPSCACGNIGGHRAVVGGGGTMVMW